MASAQEIPTQMRAAAIDHFGSPDVVHLETVPVPRLGKKDILVRVTTAGVGEWDPDLVSGSFQDADVQFPRVLGSDGAGTVVAVGSGVERFAVGDRVYGWGFGNPKGGFFAEYAAINERDVAAIPDTLSFEEAGALAVSGITALQGFEELALDEGDSVIIFGASGGVGHVAVQLAKALGLRVFAVASKRDGVELAQRVGADHVAEGHSRSLLRELREFAPDGFDGALVFAGARGWKKELATVVKGGTIAWPNGVEPIPAVPKRVDGRPYNGEDSPAAFARLNELIARRPFHIELSKVYPLDATAQALRDVQRHHIGKLAIKIEQQVEEAIDRDTDEQVEPQIAYESAQALHRARRRVARHA
jgi:NADPH2:quinone reductase